jgi:uncharacterized membrane protein
MVGRPYEYWRRANLVLLIVSLSAIVAGLTTLLVGLWHAEQVVPPARRAYLAGMAVLTTVLLIVALFCLVMLVVRLLIFRLENRPKGRPTEYVNAWDLAGQRTEVPDYDEVDVQSPDDPDRPDDDWVEDEADDDQPPPN